MPPPDGGAGRGAGDSATKDRLHRVSRHFLSEEDELFRIAVLTAPDDPHILPVDGLARALARLGRAVAIIDVTEGLISLIRPHSDYVLRSPAAQESDTGVERFLANMRCNHPPDIMIIAAPPAAAHIAACDLALLAVPAQTDGLRSAYLRLKTLAQLDRTPPHIGITVTGAGSRDEAASRFNAFALAAHNFLGIRVTSYAYLAGEHVRETTHRKRGSPVEDIARLLLDDWRASRQRRQDQDEPEQAEPQNITTKEQP